MRRQYLVYYKIRVNGLEFTGREHTFATNENVAKVMVQKEVLRRYNYSATVLEMEVE